MLGALNMTTPRRRQSAFTLIELLIVVAVAAVILGLAAPSFQRMIQTERLRGVHAQLVTDLNMARTEAVSRGTFVQFRVQSNTTQTCYIFYAKLISTPTSSNCSCLATTPCGTDQRLIKTVIIPRSEGIGFSVVTSPSAAGAVIDPRTGSVHLNMADYGGLFPSPFAIETSSLTNTSLKLRATMALSGLVTPCVPSGSTISGTAC